MRSLDLLYIFICFNIGIWLVSLITGGFGAMSPMNFEGLALVSVGIFLGASVISGIVSYFTGADPLKIMAISIFSGSVVTLYTSSIAILGSFAILMDKGSTVPIATAFVTIFGLFQGLVSVMGIIQFVTGGFKSND